MHSSTHHAPASVVFALPDLNGGGAERAVLNIVRNWSSSDLSPVVLLASRQGPYLSDVPDDVPLITLDVPLGIRHTTTFNSQLRSALADLRVHTVVSTLTSINKMILRARLLRQLPTRVTVVEQTNFSVRQGSGLFSWLRRQEIKLLYRSANRIITPSRGLSDDLARTLSLPRERVESIPNPVEITAVREQAHQYNPEPLAVNFEHLQSPVICTAGRLTAQKAVDELMLAFSHLPADLKGSLIVLGEGEQQSYLENLAHSLGIAGNVHFAGFSANPWWYMRHSRLFALSSHWEGFGNVIAEAMACGTPVVATDCPYGPAEIISHEVNGLLVQPGDIPGLTAALTRLLRDDALAAKLADNAYERVQDFEATAISARYVS